MAHPSEGQAPTLDREATVDKLRDHGRTWWICGLLSGPAAIILFALARTRPGWTEEIYGQHVGPTLGWLLARASGWIPFSVAEWFLLWALVTWLGRWLNVIGRRHNRARELTTATLFNLHEMSVALAVFYLVFGLHYARPALDQRMDWRGIPDNELLRACADESLHDVNSLYRHLHHSDDLGQPTSWSPDFATVDAALEQSWPSVAQEFHLGMGARRHRGPVKGLLISPLLSRLGLSGFYFPWTGEANRNRDIPVVLAPQVAAHEKAHQRGVAREDEAGFLGWAAAVRSTDPLARYSAALYAHRNFVLALMKVDSGHAKKLVNARLAGVQRDVDDVHRYWARHRGRGTRIADRVNDRYLRSQAVPDGTGSYSRSLRLLLLYATVHGPALTPHPEG